MLSKKTARMGDEGKAVGCVPPTALLFEQGGQYRIAAAAFNNGNGFSSSEAGRSAILQVAGRARSRSIP
jgi:hypothetical protein